LGFGLRLDFAGAPLAGGAFLARPFEPKENPDADLEPKE
jgi:hypothetical protein